MSYDSEYDSWDEAERLESDDGEPTISCPYCRRDIHEDAPRCPYCEHYISEEDSPSGAKPNWLVVGVLVCLLIVVMWVMAG